MNAYEWTKKLDPDLMYPTETLQAGRLSASIHFGSLGGYGPPTEAFLHYGPGSNGPLLYVLPDPIESTEAARKALENAIVVAEERLATWKDIARGNGDHWYLQRPRGELAQILLCDRQKPGAILYWIKPGDQWIYGSRVVVYGQGVEFGTLDEALEAADSKSSIEGVSARETVFYDPA